MKSPHKWLVIAILLLCLPLAACTGGTGEEANSALNTQVAAVVAQTQAALSAAATPTAPAPQAVLATPTLAVVTSPPADQDGVITGTAYLQSPPTPPLTIYAVDVASSTWAYIETMQSPGATSFTMILKPGTYQIFAFPAGIAYSQDGLSLSTVTLAAGQTVSGIEVRPPSQTACGSSFGIPAAPDGRYAAIPAAAPGCNTGSQFTYKPMDSAECTTLNNTLSLATKLSGMVTSPVEFEDYINSVKGQGCQIVIAATGATVPNAGVIGTAGNAVLLSQGWQEDQSYGAGGAGGYSSAYKKGAQLCLMSVKAAPVDPSLCSSKNEPSTVCWSRLAPEQMRYSYTLNCAQRVSP